LEYHQQPINFVAAVQAVALSEAHLDDAQELSILQPMAVVD
jgi:hypothetical protein